jgi:hypothetical protein
LAPLTSALQFEVGTWPDGQVTLSRYFTICVHSGTVFPRAAPENGIVMVAYHVVRTSQSRIRQSRSPESTWN